MWWMSLPLIIHQNWITWSQHNYKGTGDRFPAESWTCRVMDEYIWWALAQSWARILSSSPWYWYKIQLLCHVPFHIAAWPLPFSAAVLPSLLLLFPSFNLKVTLQCISLRNDLCLACSSLFSVSHILPHLANACFCSRTQLCIYKAKPYPKAKTYPWTRIQIQGLVLKLDHLLLNCQSYHLCDHGQVTSALWV